MLGRYSAGCAAGGKGVGFLMLLLQPNPIPRRIRT